MARRLALLIGNGQFRADSRLAPLRGPANDVQYLGLALENPEYGGFEVRRFVDSESHALQHSIERSLNDIERDDLVLLYYSGHGKLDSRGQLSLATSNTSLDALRSTSVSISFLKALFEDCRSNRIVLVLDCCFSGAVGRSFAGVRGSVDDQLAIAQGRGIHILTSSTAIETSTEREHEADGRVTGVFTRCLVDGIFSGAADIDNDSVITVEDLRRYLGRQMRGQSPRYWGFETADDVVIAKNPRPRPRPSAHDRAPREDRTVATEPIFTLPVTVLSIAALGTEVVRVIYEGAEGRGSARWAPAITSALVAALPWVRPAERRYRTLTAVGLGLFLLRDIVAIWPYYAGGADAASAAPGAVAMAWAGPLFEAGAFVALLTAFRTRGGAYPSPLLIPYVAFAIVVISVAVSRDAGISRVVGIALTSAAACAAAQAWYRHGNPGASWAAFGGVLWLGSEFVTTISGTSALEGPSLAAAATWLVAMSVRDTVTAGIRAHPASSRWVLAGSLTFFLWLLAARIYVFVLALADSFEVGPVAAAVVAAIVWGVVGGALVVILGGPSRAWPWKPFIGTGMLAAIACWLLVQNATGNRETPFDAALACSVWALPLAVPFTREATRPATPLAQDMDRLVWIAAIAAIGWSVVLIPDPDSALWSLVDWTAVVVATVGTIACAFFAHTAYRQRRGSA